MATINPLITWYLDTNATASQITSRVDLGRIDADTTSPVKEIYIWNNYGGTSNASNAEELTLTARDINGGDGTTIGNLTPSISEDWNQVRVDTLGESSFTPIGKGGVGTINPTGSKLLGTTGATTNIDFNAAVTFATATQVSLGTFIKPTTNGDFFFEVIQAGTTGDSEPTYLLTEGLITDTGTARLRAIPRVKTAPQNTLLGLKNNTLADGSNASLAAGNFVKFSHRIEVPVTASSGVQVNLLKASYKFV